MKTLIALAATLAIAAPALAQDGGKVGWNHDPKDGLAQAKKKNKATMMFFTALG